MRRSLGLVVIPELRTFPDTMDGVRSILGESKGVKGTSRKGEGAMIQHLLSIGMRDRGGLDAEVSEHRV